MNMNKLLNLHSLNFHIERIVSKFKKKGEFANGYNKNLL